MNQGELSYIVSWPSTPILILHGLLGSKNNWKKIGETLSEKYPVFLVDLPGHGESPTLPSLTYLAMAEEVLAFFDLHSIQKAHVIGHSMGGKVAMNFALKYPTRVQNLIIVDMSPSVYPQRFAPWVNAMRQLDCKRLRSRKHADELLQKQIPKKNIRQFLLTNLKRTDQGYVWRVDLERVANSLENLRLFPKISEVIPFLDSTLFLRGEHSDYITAEHEKNIFTYFPNAVLQTVENAGHWIHADQPKQFVKRVMEFFSHS